MNMLDMLNKRGINTDVLTIILLVLALAVVVMIFLFLSSEGKDFLGSLFGLSLAPE
jgi:hypothetical protein